MRTLYVTAGPPVPADRGARIRDHALISRLAAAHPSALVALVGSREEAQGLEPMRPLLTELTAVIVPERVRPPARLRARGPRTPLACAPFLSREAVAAVSSAVRRIRPDLVQVEHWFLAPLLEALRYADDPPAAVASLHNVASEQYLTMSRSSGPVTGAANSVKARLAGRVERDLLGRFESVVCVSGRDRDLIGSIAPGAAVEVVPNGADTGVLSPLPDEGEPGQILFVANLHYRPNRDAAEWLCRRVLPELIASVPGAGVRLVGPGADGRAASLGKLPGVELIGPVEDVVPHYRRAQVAVAPIHAGGGTRLKVLEAMALGRPVVSTTIGCEGLEAKHGRHLLIADEPAAFAESIAALLRFPECRRHLARAARAWVERSYSWDRSAAALAQAHERALARRRQGKNRRAATA